ncbi:YjeF N-terminal domain-like protein [Myriangium duriaei CBS 260.36]|uniref:NAD(P)H-hydrate epimerase n=1 Tax=Myriangium duriaei CBS 260.36 TaxID=1168546 RepID=A0A9P4MGD0_9PEZI|nr:YjeF N-terminal domain-like protein [Myriangium duriaei CBS 260.36]
MALRTLSAKTAAALDEHLMSTGQYTIDQLMELAGLSVSQALYRLSPPTTHRRVLIACGPGNNGGDGLVAARHLVHLGYAPSIYWPKAGKAEIYARLGAQLKDLRVPRVEDFSSAIRETDVVVDAVFGFSFSGEVREPFPAVIKAMKEAKLPVLAVDAPSSWDIESGPPEDGPGVGYMPTALISLTAPKPLVKHFKGRHFVGGRFLGKDVADKFEIDVPPYKGLDQVVEVDVKGEKL